MLTLSLAAALAVAVAQDSSRYVVFNHGRPAGDMRVVSAGDSAVVRFQYQDRQRGPRIETRYRFTADGRVVLMETRGLTADARPAPVSERFEIIGDTARWSGGGDSARVRADGGAFYRLRSVSPYDDVLLARFLLRQPNRTGRLLPAGTARLEIAADTTVTVNGQSRRVRLAIVDGIGLAPSAVWLDERDALFASSAGWFITFPPGADSVLPALRAIERRYRERRSAARIACW